MAENASQSKKTIVLRLLIQGRKVFSRLPAFTLPARYLYQL